MQSSLSSAKKRTPKTEVPDRSGESVLFSIALVISRFLAAPGTIFGIIRRICNSGRRACVAALHENRAVNGRYYFRFPNWESVLIWDSSPRPPQPNFVHLRLRHTPLGYSHESVLRFRPPPAHSTAENLPELKFPGLLRLHYPIWPSRFTSPPTQFSRTT